MRNLAEVEVVGENLYYTAPGLMPAVRLADDSRNYREDRRQKGAGLKMIFAVCPSLSLGSRCSL